MARFATPSPTTTSPWNPGRLLVPRNAWFVPLAALLAAGGSIVLVHIALYLYVATYPYVARDPLNATPSPAVLNFFTDVYLRAVYAALCAVAAYAALRYGLARGRLPRLWRACLLGAVTALLAAASLHTVVQLLYPPAVPYETAAFGSLGLAAAVGGAVAGRRALAGDHARRSARAALDLSETAAQILDALAGRLDGPVLEATLWRVPCSSASDSPRDFPASGMTLWARYLPPATPGTPSPASPTRLESASLLGDDGSPTLVDVARLDEEAARALRARGTRGVLIAPLYAPGPESTTALVAVLIVELARPRAGRNARRLISSLAPQAGKNLNYITLVAERSRQELREKLCTDIHDTVANHSVSIVKQLDEAEELIPDPPARVKAAVGKARENARQMHESSRHLMKELRPANANAALRDAMASHMAAWERRTGHRAELAVSGSQRELGTDANVALLRVLKEGLTNADKHAGLLPGAPPVTVNLRYAGSDVRLVVADTGSGYDPTEVGSRPTAQIGGFGLASLARSLADVGGTILTETAPGAGTRLVATVPTAPPVRHPSGSGGTTLPPAEKHPTPEATR